MVLIEMVVLVGTPVMPSGSRPTLWGDVLFGSLYQIIGYCAAVAAPWLVHVTLLSVVIAPVLGKAGQDGAEEPVMQELTQPVTFSKFPCESTAKSFTA